jgi:hypothetical protein
VNASANSDLSLGSTIQGNVQIGSGLSLSLG